MKLDFLDEFEFFTGVPDSQLKPLCNYLYAKFGISKKHIIAANEGNAVALAAGFYLSTGKIPVVYMQNSGEGNIINPVASLMNRKVYSIPCLFIIGWRGEPGVHDEPQHIYQGEITCKLLEDMEIEYFIITKDTGKEELNNKLKYFKTLMLQGRQTALIIKKNALEFDGSVEYSNSNTIIREDAIKHIVKKAGNDIVVSTTGKASRELFEIREANSQTHATDFLTVGSMGHSSSIALGIALEKPDRKIWVIDGDGALLMHMGAMALIGANNPHNLIHIVINNSAHETVGGQPTVAGNMDLLKIADGCGYKKLYRIKDSLELDKVLNEAKSNNELTFIEIKCAIGSRNNLGRPTTTPQENKAEFMKYLSNIQSDKI